MAYGLKYQTQFTSRSDAYNAEKDYTLQFLFKDYTGGATSLTGGSTTVIQKCTVDDPFAPIKGQSLEIKLLNYGNCPITNFYSEDDDGVKVILMDSGGNVKFVGFIVQDDIFEPMVDFVHEISLSANDSLGLLKGVILSDARTRRPYEVNVMTNGPLDQILVSALPPFYVSVGSDIEVLGVTYNVTAISTVAIVIGGRNYNYTLSVTPAVAAPIPEQDITLYVIGPIDLLQKNSLLDLINACLFNTNLQLITNIYCNILEVNQFVTNSSFEQTLVDSQVFLSGEVFQNCYDVLTKILETFRCSIFQANGQWIIIHWDEIRQYPNWDIPGFVYDENFQLIGTTIFANVFTVGADPELTRHLAGLQKGTFRGYKFVRKQFDYRQPKYLLRNYDLLKVGALRATYVSAGLTYYEYEATDFLNGWPTNNITRFIRVVKDSLDNEIERYLVLKGAPSDTDRAVQAQPFEINLEDRIRLSFSFRTTVNPVTVINFAVRNYDGTNSRYAHDDATWQAGLGFAFNTFGGANTWNSVSIEPNGVPYDGLLYCYFAQVCPTPNAPTDETHYKDIRLEYTPYISDTTKIIGQVHRNEQTPNVKANSDNTISIDDSPKNSIVGTLFLSTVVGLLQKRASQWKYVSDPTITRLGQLITREEILYRSRTRTKLDGSFVGLYQGGNCVSLATAFRTIYDPTKNYVPALMSIDYKANQFSCTPWEINDTSEPVLAPDYSFTYIYDAK